MKCSSKRVKIREPGIVVTISMVVSRMTCHLTQSSYYDEESDLLQKVLIPLVHQEVRIGGKDPSTCSLLDGIKSPHGSAVKSGYCRGS